jgi:hypothetical protein
MTGPGGGITMSDDIGPEPTIKERARCARAAIEGYNDARRELNNMLYHENHSGPLPELSEGDLETAVQDLLSDLMHLADQHGFRFAARLELARRIYKAEKREEKL